MKTSLKNRLRILLNFPRLSQFALLLKRREFLVGAKEREPRPSSDWDRRIYFPAVPVLKWTWNFVISRRSCAGTAKKCTKKRDARAELLFCSLNLLLFWRSPCCRRRSFVRSLLLERVGCDVKGPIIIKRHLIMCRFLPYFRCDS